MPTQNHQSAHLPADAAFQSLRLELNYQAVQALSAFGRKTRSHTEADIEQRAFAISHVGFINPIVVKDGTKVVAGHARLEAARRLGYTHVPCIDAHHLTDEAARLYKIMDNRLAELAGWDPDALRIEFEELSALELNIPIEVTGFNSPQIDTLMLAGEGGSERGDLIPKLPVEPTSQLGDLWLLGEHKLLCGDALKPASLETLLGDELAQAVFTDIPYNLSRRAFSSNDRHDDFVMGAGEMSEADFMEFSRKTWLQISRGLVLGGLAYFCIDWRHVRTALESADGAQLELLNIIAWDKKVGGMGSFYRSQHEFIVLMRKEGAAHTNRVRLGSNGRNRSNVWSYEGMSGFGAGKAKARDMHPSVKSLALVRDALLDCTAQGDLVLDLFSGSGTTIIAAHDAKRRGRATELDPRYADVSVTRWEDFSGQAASALAVQGQAVRQSEGPAEGLQEHGDPAERLHDRQDHRHGGWPTSEDDPSGGRRLEDGREGDER